MKTTRFKYRNIVGPPSLVKDMLSTLQAEQEGVRASENLNMSG